MRLSQLTNCLWKTRKLRSLHLLLALQPETPKSNLTGYSRDSPYIFGQHDRDFRECLQLRWRNLSCSLVLILAMAAYPSPVAAYSVLTHEELVDLAWNDSIRPLLLSRYPGTSQASLNEAHAYAYGGAAIQDMGYYPFGKEFFSDLTHYVRTGDFIASLFRNARNVDELAFAIGALSHYLGDSTGHSECINPATAVEFPRLARKYGEAVTYEQNPHAHVRTEFAFDIDQLTHRRLAPAEYLRHVGLQVPRGQVERAFYETYGLRLHEVLGPERPAIRGYRSAVRSFIPRFAHAETVLHGRGFPPDADDAAFQAFERQVQQAPFQHWDGTRHHAGFVTHMLAFAMVVLPRIGPLSDLAIRGPNKQTESLYIHSVDDTMTQFRSVLRELEQQPGSPVTLPNRDLDTGELVKPGAYALTDKTYAVLLQKVTADPADAVPAGIRRDLLKFYSDPNAPIVTKKDDDAWKRVERELATLRQMPTRTPHDGFVAQGRQPAGE